MKHVLLCCLAVALGACSSVPEESTSAGTGVPLPAGFGKDDNWIATSASEYTFRGTLTAALPADFGELPEAEQAGPLDEAVSARTGAVTRAAQQHVEAVIREANQARAGEDPVPADEDAFVDYFIYVKASQRGGTATDVVVDGTTATFNFALEFVGSIDLIQMVVGNDGDEAFEVQIDGVDGTPETVTIQVEASPSTDAFPRYDVLLADGIYDIAIHFGGDYNEERYDLETAKWTVDFLFESGWQNTAVTSFEDLRYDSPPFTLQLTLEGRPVEARVYLYHAQMDDDAGQEQSLLRQLVETSVRERDVVIYSGHAGADAGMLLDYHPRYELDDDDFDELEMRSEYQIWVFDGCNSYRTYVDAVLANPARSFETTDIVTTVNTTPFSAGYEIINRFVHWLTISDETGAHIPVTWNTLLRGVNDTYLDVHYGVHGIDQDPKLNPYGGAELTCAPCSSDADCGAGGNFCMNYEDGSACGIACSHESACGDGFECISVFDDPDLFYMPKQCVRTNLTCG